MPATLFHLIPGLFSDYLNLHMFSYPPRESSTDIAAMILSLMKVLHANSIFSSLCSVPSPLPPRICTPFTSHHDDCRCVVKKRQVETNYQIV